MEEKPTLNRYTIKSILRLIYYTVNQLFFVCKDFHEVHKNFINMISCREPVLSYLLIKILLVFKI